MAGLEGSVDVPLAGKQPKKLVVGGVLVVGTLVVVYYYRKRKSVPAAASGVTTDQFPADGMAGGNVTGDGTGVGTGNPATPGGPPFANNAAWSNWAIQELQALNPAIDAGALTDALGVYLEGGQVTPAQKTLVFDALAVAGDPPVAGPNNYPPKVKTGPTTNHTTVIVPQLVGDPVADAESALSALGLKARANSRTGMVTAQEPAAGRRVADGSTVTLTVKAGGPPPAGEVLVPNVLGERVENAIETLQDAGLRASFGTRKPDTPYVVESQSPRSGIRVKRGSTVRLSIKAGTNPFPPRPRL